MRILDIHIDGFGKFENRDVTFGKRINIIHGANEAGKSTMHGFIEAMLFGVSKKAKGFSQSQQEIMKPWKEGVPYGGTMRIEHDGSVYRIERTFDGNGKLAVYNETAAEPVKDPEIFLSSVLGGVTRGTFDNTVSIGQLSGRTGTALVSELKGYLENVSSTENPELNAKKAVELLLRERASLEKQLAEEAAKDYAAALSRIKKLETEINAPENENRILACEKTLEDLTEACTAREKELMAVVDKVSEENRVLSFNGIESENDVEHMDNVCRGICEDYLNAKKHMNSKGRIIGMIVCILAVAAGGYGFVTGMSEQYLCLFGAAISLIGFIVLIVRSVQARRRFAMKEADLLELVGNRLEGNTIDSNTLEKLITENHRFDDLLAKRSEDRKEKDRIEDETADLRRKQSAARKDLEEQQKIHFAVEGKLAEQNSLKERAAALRLAVAENNKIKAKTDAIDIAVDTINDLSESIRGRLGTYLNKEASEALNRITGGRYRGLDVGSGNDIFLSTKDGMVSASSVSAGTLDQVYLAVRLAAAGFVTGGRDRLPLLFDDSFALYDDERLSGALRHVADGYDGQSIIFTCHRREQEALNGQEYTLTDL